MVNIYFECFTLWIFQYTNQDEMAFFCVGGGGMYKDIENLPQNCTVSEK